MSIKMQENEDVERSHYVQYQDFNKLFGIKKHELDRQ